MNRVVIVGGVAGGATAAARIRRLDENAEITIYERSGYVSYANCGLPYYIGGVIEDPEELTLNTPESLERRFHIHVNVNHEVTRIDPVRKVVEGKNLVTGETFEKPYDKLLLSPGAHPIRPEVPGLENRFLFTLRTVEDTLRIREAVEQNHPRSAAIIGGGFIGLEVAENLRGMGLDVTIIQRGSQLLKQLDVDMAALLHAKLRAKGIHLKLSRHVTGFEETGTGVRVLLKEEDPLEADMAVMAIGVAPENHLAAQAGLELGMKGAIVVNDQMQTSVPDIYAVGDAVQIRQKITGSDAVISLAGPANKEGRTAADNICGVESHYKGSLGSFVVKLFDSTAAGMGLTEAAAKAQGIDVDSVVLSPASHASYYPDASVMTMKVVYEKGSLRILGAQIFGKEGVDKRLDVLATAAFCGMRADELKDLDLAYAPPYSSAKDPVNMAGFMIENVASGKLKTFHWSQVDQLPRDGSVTLLDVRTPGEYARGHAEGFLNVPVDDLRARLCELDKSKPAYVMCQSGLRSYIACRILMQNGFECYNLCGGYRFYSSVVREQAVAEQEYPCGMDK